MDEPLATDRIRRYLLADLPEQEEQRLEELLLQDHALLELVRAAEDDLIDEFVRGELRERTRRKFEARFLTSRAQRDKVEFARTLQASVFAGARVRRADGSRLTAVWPLALAARGWLAWGLAAAAAAMVAIGGALFVRNQQRPEPGDGPQAQAPLRTPAVPVEITPPAPAPDASTVLTVTLTPDLLRDPAAAEHPVAVDARVQTLRLVLRVEHPPGDARYRVAIETAEGRRVWSRDDIERVPAASPTMTVDAPSSALPNGDYIVLLQAAGPGSSRFHDAHEYVLSVRRAARQP